MEEYFGEVWLTRLLLQRGIAAIYLTAFLSALNQFPALLGERGLLPAPGYIAGINFASAPSLFHWRYSDRFFRIVAIAGITLSIIALFGLSEQGPLWLSLSLWLVLWVLYLSIVNVGQTFYAFGWESMLLEAGFFAAFLGSTHIEASLAPVLILRWMLFRTEVGAGLIKLRHDQCWRDLTCLYYHYETQPLPNPLSWFFHRLPKFVHRFSVAFSHFVQLVAPFGLFAPQPIASIAGLFIIVHQLLLIVSGNYSWLNWLTVVLGFSAFSDEYLRWVIPLAPSEVLAAPIWYESLLSILAGMVVVLSWKPVMNLFSKHQLMNYSYNPFHLVNTYGAFGSMTKVRYEIVIEGTTENEVTSDTKWLEYEFRAKPGPLKRWPSVVAPYHLRLDWLMWFLPFRVRVTGNRIAHSGYELWFVAFVEKLLDNDQQTIGLLKRSPFGESPPAFVRARFYRYKYTSWRQLKDGKGWWTREYLGDYLPAVSREQLTR